MKVLGKPIIDAFSRKHADASGALRAWVQEVEFETTTWKDSHDIKARYSSASFLSDNVVIFNIKGNKYRLEVRVKYVLGVVRVLDVNTHAEYDKKNKKRNPRKR